MPVHITDLVLDTSCADVPWVTSLSDNVLFVVGNFAL